MRTQFVKTFSGHLTDVQKNLNVYLEEKAVTPRSISCFKILDAQYSPGVVIIAVILQHDENKILPAIIPCHALFVWSKNSHDFEKNVEEELNVGNRVMWRQSASCTPGLRGERYFVWIGITRAETA